MRYNVRLTQEAELDLLDIHTYIVRHDDVPKAKYVIDKLEAKCLTLENLPHRGHVPPELERLQVLEYREVHWKPYRIIYEIADNVVNVLAVLDGRRDLQSLLMRRLLR